MNDDTRYDWIQNDEGLYDWMQLWCRTNRKTERAFIRANRAEIDDAIAPVLRGDKQAHHLKYDR